MTGYHTRWARPEEPADDPSGSRSGEALYDIRTVLGLPVAELAMRAGLTEQPTHCRLTRTAVALPLQWPVSAVSAVPDILVSV